MIQLAIIEDNRNYSKALEHILEDTGEINILHLLHSAEKISEKFEELRPDVVIMDIDLPGKNGIEAVKELKQRWPEIKILMLTVFEDADKIFDAIKAGANGYLLKKDSPTRIVEAIVEVSNGESPINSVIAGKLLHYFQHPPSNDLLGAYHLTPREDEILHHLVNGHSYKEIAAICNISFQTLNSHTKNIYAKLDVHSRFELAARFGKGLF